VKICCIKSVAEAQLALRAGATALGLVSEMPSGPGMIAEERITEIVANVDGKVETFLLTSQREAGAIVAQQRRTAVDTLQLVHRLPPEELSTLRSALPNVRLVQVIHVLGLASVEEAVGIPTPIDALLLDSGDPGAPVPELGGTGRVHDWSLSREIVTRTPLPVYLAGGLKADNVAEAIRTVRPTGVDLCNGVRRAGKLDADQLAAFFDAAYAAETETEK